MPLPKNSRLNKNIVPALRQRQGNTDYNRRLETQFYISPEFIHRLRLSGELEGHTGCVNCLQWNESGSILASGSDDYQVILWDTYNRRQLRTIQTGHTNNIFSVQFAPEKNDRIIISGAGDGKVRVHDITGSTSECVQVFGCHFARVKRLAVTPLEPNIILSAGEDGVVMQFDLRAPASCRDVCNHVLVNLNAHAGPEAEVKCIALNPRRPEMMAVGANDPYVRVYDRRMLSPRRIRITPVAGRDHPRWDRQAIMSLGLEDENYDFPMSSVQYYVAGHLPVKYREMKRRYRPLASTYVTFSPCGGDLLVNLGGEQIYLFDINGRRRSLLADLRKYFAQSEDGGIVGHSNGYTSNGLSSSVATNGFSKTFALSATLSSTGSSSSESKRRVPLPARAEYLKQRANSSFERKDYNVAIMLYNQAVLVAPKAPVLYANRAAAYMKRNWDGDVYSALRDCYMTLILDPDHLKAHFRLARCLHLLNQHVEAKSALEMFKTKFIDQSKTSACLELDIEIDKALGASGKKASGDQNQPKRKRSRSGSFSDIDTGDNSEEGVDVGQQSRSDDISEQEAAFRELAVDYDRRFCGHCNTTTDIKEANFFGPHGEYIMAGSDDGRFFIWDRQTCSIMRILQGDESIVNCLQPHPTQCLLATSGIETTVKLWMPMPEDGTKDPRVVLDTEFDQTASQNQKRMHTDPIEIMLQNLGYHLTHGGGDSDSDSREAAPREVQCNQS